MRFLPTQVRKSAEGADDLNVVDGQRFFTPNRLMAMVIVLISALVYLPCLAGLPVWDDRAILAGWGIGGGKTWQQCFTNPFLQHYYRPFTSLSYFLDEHFLGKTPILLHQTNLILHAIATVLVMMLTRALFGRPRLALLAGLVFAIQPAQVTTIAWIGGRCDQLGALLSVATALALVRYHQTNRWAFLVAGLATFFSAMMVKEQFALVGLMVPVLSFVLRPQEERTRYAVRTTIPFAVIGALFVGLWLAHYPNPYSPTAFGLSEQISRLGRTTFLYTTLFLLPNPYSMHNFSLEGLRNPAIVGIGLALFVGIFFGVRKLWRTDRRLGFLALVCLVGFLPVSNIVALPSLLAAPYRLGVICPFVSILIALAWSATYRKRQYVPAFAFGFCALCGFVLTPWGTSKWKDETTWFETAVHYDPELCCLRGSLANDYLANQRTAEALAQTEFVLDKLFSKGGWRDYERIPSIVENDPAVKYRLSVGDGFTRVPSQEISIWLTLRGKLLVSADRDREAAQALKAAIQLQPANHNAWLQLGQIAQSHHSSEALHLFRMACACGTTDSISASLLAKEYRKRGMGDQAYAVLCKVPAMKPDFGDPLLDLAEMQIARGKCQDAIMTLAQARQTIVDPNRLRSLEARLDRRVAFR